MSDVPVMKGGTRVVRGWFERRFRHLPYRSHFQMVPGKFLGDAREELDWPQDGGRREVTLAQAGRGARLFHVLRHVQKR